MTQEFLLKPTSHEEAMDFIRSKPIVSQRVFNRMLPELKARAFVIAGVESATVMQHIRDRLADLPAGGDWNEIKKDIAGKMSPFLDDGDEAMIASTRRAELMLRTHGFQAYQAAQYNVMQEVKDAMPYWQYMTMEDDGVRPAHAALDGLILPADSPFWQNHFPPWDWGCRCQVVPVTEDDFEDVRSGRSDYGRALSDGELRILERENRLALPSGNVISVASDYQKGRAGALYWNPGDLRIPLDQLEGRYDADIWENFQRVMKSEPIEGGVTAWEWLNGGKLLDSPWRHQTTKLPSERIGFDNSLQGVSEDGKRKLMATEAAMRNSPVENAAIVTDDGHNIVFRTGTRKEVILKDADIEQMHGKLLTHSHPDGGPFSLEDVIIACKGNASEIRIPYPGGSFWMRPPSGLLNKNLVEKFVNAWTEQEEKNGGEIKTVSAAHAAWQRIAKQMNLNYAHEGFEP